MKTLTLAAIFLLAASALMQAQTSRLFHYDQDQVNSLMDQVDEMSCPSNTFPLYTIGAGPADGRGRTFLSGMIGGCLGSVGSLYAGALADWMWGKALIPVAVTGTVLGVLWPTLHTHFTTHDRKQTQTAALGGVAGVVAGLGSIYLLFLATY
ncbi:MAG: hypothetical protein R6V75_10470 [Bacteroidales bacterium]